MSVILEFIKERCSVRDFQNKPLSEKIINKLLTAAQNAPSAGNLQPWKFFVITHPDLKKDLAQAAFQGFINKAPLVIVVCALPERSAARYGERGRNLYCLQDTAAAVQNILLTATSLGLGSCWVGAFSETEVSKILHLSAEIRPVALIPLGYPQTEPQPTKRIPLEKITQYF